MSEEASTYITLRAEKKSILVTAPLSKIAALSNKYDQNLIWWKDFAHLLPAVIPLSAAINQRP